MTQRARGASGPMSVTLVLLPGLDGTGALFEPLLRELPPYLQPLVVTYPPEGSQDYATLTRFVLAQLPHDRPFVLLGESFSGPVAVLAAAERPHGLIGIVLCASFVVSPRRSTRLFALLARLPPAWFIGRLAAPYVLMGRSRTRALATLLAQAVKTVPRATSSARYSTVAEADVRAALAGLDVPALYLQASDDLVVPASAAEVFEKTAARARVVVIQAPHFLLQCAPAAAAKEIEKFVREVSDSL